MNFLQKNARLVSTIVVGLLALIFPGTDFQEEGLGFFELLFGNLAIPVGMALMLLLNWVGDRNLLSFTKSPAFLTTVAVLITISVSAFGNLSGIFVEFFSSLQATGNLTLGSLIGLLVSIFGDRDIPVQLESARTE